jgi:hypothetical protein
LSFKLRINDVCCNGLDITMYIVHEGFPFQSKQVYTYLKMEETQHLDPKLITAHRDLAGLVA